MGRKLRTGFTTGTAAAAAAKGALLHLLEKTTPMTVSVPLPNGERMVIPVHTGRALGPNRAECTVIKDAGSDPDITHGAEIGARVSFTKQETERSIQITGGEGVGRVTKPGLEVPPGECAINPVPRRMISASVKETLDSHNTLGRAAVEIFVPEGEALAAKTLNARLGILGGISILGTTGIVTPLSHGAYIATIDAGISVARAAGLQRIILTTGRRSERFFQNRWSGLPEEAFIQMGDFFKHTVKTAFEKGFGHITLAVFFGKAVKMAQGVPHTHAARSRLSLRRLSEWTLKLTQDKALAGQIASANTARHAFELLKGEEPNVPAFVGQKILTAARRFSSSRVDFRSVIFDYEGGVAFDSEGTDRQQEGPG